MKSRTSFITGDLSRKEVAAAPLERPRNLRSKGMSSEQSPSVRTSSNNIPRVAGATGGTLALELHQVRENRLFRTRHKAFLQFRIDARDDGRRACGAVAQRVDDLELSLAPVREIGVKQCDRLHDDRPVGDR